MTVITAIHTPIITNIPINAISLRCVEDIRDSFIEVGNSEQFVEVITFRNKLYKHRVALRHLIRRQHLIEL